MTLKEVVLLDSPSQVFTVRGGEKKAYLVENGMKNIEADRFINHAKLYL